MGVRILRARSVLSIKHESWSYEQEVRVFLNLKDPPDEKGLNWIEFGPILVLREVIIELANAARRLRLLSAHSFIGKQ